MDAEYTKIARHPVGYVSGGVSITYSAFFLIIL